MTAARYSCTSVASVSDSHQSPGSPESLRLAERGGLTVCIVAVVIVLQGAPGPVLGFCDPAKQRCTTSTDQLHRH